MSTKICILSFNNKVRKTNIKKQIKIKKRYGQVLMIQKGFGIKKIEKVKRNEILT